MKILVIIISLSLLGLILADEGTDSWGELFVFKDVFEFVKGCGIKDLGLCVKERALRYLDNIPNNMDLGGGLKIRGNRVERNSRHTVSLPDEIRAREEAVDNLLWETLIEFIRTHTFEFKVPEETLNDLLGKPVEEARKKKGGGGMRLRTMLLLFQLKVATIGAIALKVIGLIAFKALVIAKIAFTIASVIALKKLLESQHHTSTYEVVAHPHYEEHGHFDRSFNTFNPQDYAYKGYNALGARSSN